MIVFADIVNPSTGKTFREENLEKVHQFPIGSLVELTDDPPGGIRLHVVGHSRDCDGTPLYSLGIIGEKEIGDLAVVRGSTYPLELIEMFHGYGEEQLRLIKGV